MENDRRFRSMLITGDLLLSLHKGPNTPFRIATNNPIPEGATIHDIRYDFHADLATITIRDDSFEQVAPGASAPVVATTFSRVDDGSFVPIQAGDVVRLKSGGPKMTASRVDGTMATCVWHQGDGEKPIVRAEFDVVCLERMD